MSSAHLIDEDLVRRLPLPLARLYRRAHNAKTALERHQAAYYLWEASLKLLGSVAVAAYTGRGERDPRADECLRNLDAPALGHWREIVRRLVPALAPHDGGFAALADVLGGRVRHDLPRAAGLDAALVEALEGRAGARSTVRIDELLDRLVRYRNKVIGHGAVGPHPEAYYERMSRALLAGVPQLIEQLDALAGRRLVYLADVRRQASGRWLVECYELTGEVTRRAEWPDLPDDECTRGLLPGRLCAAPPGPAGPPDATCLLSLHPLLVYDAEEGDVLFLNGRTKQGIEYLSYGSGRVVRRPGSAGDEAAPPPAPEPPAPAPPERPDDPRRVGDFELLSELGRGGMGVVYRAWQPSLGRQVALKCLLRAGDARAEARFQREIHALGRVEHPHLVKVFTSGADGDQWFYAMELVEGADLGRVCEHLAGSTASAVGEAEWQRALTTAADEARRKEKSLSEGAPAPRGPLAPAQAAAVPPTGAPHVRRVADIVRQVAEAAQALHEAGVVHRDIKPGNVMLTADGTQAILMDLGLAQLADEGEGRLTRTRQFVGTLRYASPEQVLAVGRVGPRSDVYSLGATLWELLTLRPIYGATEQTPTPELMQRIQYAEPGGVRALNPRVPRDLDAIIMRCLEKDPARRYASAGELAEEVRRFLAGEPVRARPVGEMRRLGRWCRRNPVVTSLAAGLALALALGFAGVWWKWREAEQAKTIAEQASRTATDTAAAEAAARERAELSLYFQRIALADHEQVDGNPAQAEARLDACPPPLRRWEWYYLKRLCRERLLATNGHMAGVSEVAFSPDQSQFASCGYDNTLKVWDTKTRRVLHTLRGHDDAVTGVAWTPDGKRLVSASYDETLRGWDAATGGELFVLRGHRGIVYGLTMSPDGRLLASAGFDNLVIIWDLETRQKVRELSGHAGGVTAVAFSPDGKRLASASWDRSVKLWDTATWACSATLTGHNGRVLAVAFSRDGQRLASGSEDRTAKVWDLTGRESPRDVGKFDRNVKCVAFSPDGSRLAAGGFDDVIEVCDAATGRIGSRLLGHRALVTSLAFTSDGRRLVSSSWDKTIRFWDLAAHEEIPPGPGESGRQEGRGADQASLTLQGPNSPIQDVKFSPTAELLASVNNRGDVSLWDGRAGTGLVPLGRHEMQVIHAAFSPDGQALSTAGRDGLVKLWDVAGRRELRALHAGPAPVYGTAFSRDGRRLATASGDHLVKLWAFPSGDELRELRGHSDAARDVAFSPDLRLLASGSFDHTVRLWDADTAAEVATLRGHRAPVYCLAYTPDGRYLISGGMDQTVRIWDTESKRTVRELRGHIGSVYKFAVTPDGRRLATAGVDQTVKLWDIATGQELLTLHGHTTEVHGVAFDRTGRLLATGDAAGIMRVWDGTPLDDEGGRRPPP